MKRPENSTRPRIAWGTIKPIFALGMSERDGCFIDFRKNPAGVVISPNEGVVIFRTPPGAIPKKDVVHFYFEQETSTIIVRYCDSSGREVDCGIGTFENESAAQVWIGYVNRHYKK